MGVVATRETCISLLGTGDTEICAAFLFEGLTEDGPSATCPLGKTVREGEGCWEPQPPPGTLFAFKGSVIKAPSRGFLVVQGRNEEAPYVSQGR